MGLFSFGKKVVRKGRRTVKRAKTALTIDYNQPEKRKFRKGTKKMIKRRARQAWRKLI